MSLLARYDMSKCDKLNYSAKQDSLEDTMNA